MFCKGDVTQLTSRGNARLRSHNAAPLSPDCHPNNLGGRSVSCNLSSKGFQVPNRAFLSESRPNSSETDSRATFHFVGDFFRSAVWHRLKCFFWRFTLSSSEVLLRLQILGESSGGDLP